MKRTIVVMGWVALVLWVAGGARASESMPAGVESISFTGTVVETMNASRYTYVLVDTGKAKSWAAAPVFKVKVGDPVSITDGMPTSEFFSASLKRKFDLIYLCGRITAPGADVKPVQSGRGALPPGHPSLESTPDVPVNTLDYSDIKVPAGGKTVGEIWAGKSKWAGKPVVVRAKVVKVVPDIMGKNWLHLRDGTGQAGANDLTITTTELAAVGSTVTVTGIVSTDVDFGSGYKYDVIIENAALSAK